MSDIAIKVENLSKLYKIGTQKSGSFRESFSNIFKKNSNPVSPNSQQEKEFWALNDVSFEIKKGEAVGIIGRNGAGKSTLLKILSRITEPTKGRIEINGRVASLLEVGTGFHPELTGRENIYLNGTILGMTRREVKAKFDEIVDFSGVEKFIDTPVKHYSSGMYVRLAFAVAAHLEPEILIIDEVLAVGDAEFQKKCLGKMEDVSKNQGRTVLFVSHNMGAVQSLCSSGHFFSEGRLISSGGVQSCIQKYMSYQFNKAQNGLDLSSRKDRKGSGILKFTNWEVCDNSGQSISVLMSGQEIFFKLYYKFQENVDSLKNVLFWLQIRKDGNIIMTCNNEVSGVLFSIHEQQNIILKIQKLPLFKGRYTFNLLSVVNGSISDHINEAGEFYVEDGDFFGTGKLPREKEGILVDHKWLIN
ncbi:ABC transporter ATP-binding protein [Rapidithrix thailandica]|uniref:ABC transporter ATP-binding protein n=1 Tax=Rapidithrix thailandica TaxID=413964 RepID=A0AAW9RXG0_9BACT